MPRRWPAWQRWLATLAWLLALALLPWWLGLPLLLALVAIVALLQHRLDGEHVQLIRHALRWGLPGNLFALQRALGGDALAWGAALLGALAGYTLLAGLEAWLDRELRRAVPTSTSTADEWPELAFAPDGPMVDIIELQPPVWQSAAAVLLDPCGGPVDYRNGGYQFADGSGVDRVGPDATFSASGRWFVARLPHDRGIVLWDRERDKRHRLRGWQLAGWHHGQPWLARGDHDMPQALSSVLDEHGSALAAGGSDAPV